MTRDRLFSEGGGSSRSAEKAVWLGPKRTLKVGGQIVEERIVEAPQDGENVLDELLDGVSQSDMRRGMSGFGRFCATQPKEAAPSFRGVPTMRTDEFNPPSEEYDSEAMPSSTGFEPGVPKIEFEPNNPYERGVSLRNELWDDESLDLQSGDITMDPGFEHSYARDESEDRDRMRIEADSTFARHLAELDIFGDDEWRG